MPDKVIGTTWTLEWGDFISPTVNITAVRDGVPEVINASAPNQAVDAGYYVWTVSGPVAGSLVITIADNVYPDVFITFPSVAITNSQILPVGDLSNAFVVLLNDGLDISVPVYGIMLVDEYTFSSADAVLSDVKGYELSATGNYVRKPLENTTVTVDATNGYRILSADDVLWEYVNFSATGAVIFIDNGTDISSTVVGYLGFGETKTSNNSLFRIRWSKQQGIFYLTGQ